MEPYRAFFGFEKEPFVADVKREDILVTDALLGVDKRFDYALSCGGIAVVTGGVGSGKSTALRYAAGKYPGSAFRMLAITATSGSLLELLRQVMDAMLIESARSSRAIMTRNIKKNIEENLLSKNISPVLICDEASLFRLEVFAELHTLFQFEYDSKNLIPMVLAGQSSLVDKLQFHSSLPLASRVVARTHLEGLDLESMGNYLRHHLKITGVQRELFADEAVTAIHQASGGMPRKANFLARGALIAAAKKKESLVSAEDVGVAATEIF